MITGLPTCKLDYKQKQQLDVLLVAFMHECPFYAHMMHSIGELRPTKALPTAATDGRRIYFNPDYVFAHRVPEQVFILAHEMDHFVCQHPQRFSHYAKVGKLRGKPWSHDFANICADFVINANLVESRVGICNPDWLYDPQIPGTELWEDVYARKFPKLPPPPPPQGGNGQSKGDGQGGMSITLPDGRKFGASGHKDVVKGAKGDPTAANQGGAFDQILEPPIDPATGADDTPEEHEFKEAVARAAAVAKAQGKLPANIQRMVEELLAPQVNWRDEIRLLMTGRIGARGETWARPNRRRIVLNPLVVVPGKKGYGAELVVIAVDTSGSIGQRELDTFFAEINGILTDIRPRKIIVIGCDAAIRQVDEVHSLDEFEGLRHKGIRGGGGTDFRPVFDRVHERDWRPEALVYLTDMLGSFPEAAPAYPVIWCATTEIEAPWGDRVQIKVED